MDRFLFALAADALEPGDALAVQRARVRPGLGARLDHAHAALGGPAAGPWLHAPAGRVALGELHLDAGAWQGGDRLPLLLDGALPPEARLRLSVRTRIGERVLSPVEGTWIHLAALRRTDEGAWAVDLVLDDISGLHRVDLAVLPAGEGPPLATAEVGVRVGEAAG